MADAVVDVSQETDNSQTKEVKAYTKVEVDALVKKSVEGITSKLNANFQKQFAEIKKEKEDVVMSSEKVEHDNKREIAEMRLSNSKDRLLTKSIKAYNAAGIEVPDDEVLLDMIRVDSENPLRVIENDIARGLKNVDAVEQARLDERGEFAKKNGRKVQQTDGKAEMKTQEDFSPEELKAMPDDEFFKVQERTKQKNEE